MTKRTTRGPREPEDGASAAMDTEAQSQIEHVGGALRYERKSGGRYE